MEKMVDVVVVMEMVVEVVVVVMKMMVELVDVVVEMVVELVMVMGMISSVRLPEGTIENGQMS